MTKLAIIAIPVADAPTEKTDAEGNTYKTFDPPARQAAWDLHVRRYRKIGRAHSVGATPYFIVDCLLRDSFVTDSEATAENPATNLPSGWLVAHAVRINNQGRTTYTYTDLPDIVIPAVDITDDTFTRTKTYKRYFVNPVYDNTDPDNPVLTGVYLNSRTGNRIPFSVDNTDPDNPIIDYLFTDGTLNSDGSYTRTWTEPAKLVTHVGSGQTLLVRPEDIEGDGTYIYKRQQATVDVPAYELLEPAHPQLIEWAKDNTEGQRPAEFVEEFTDGRMEPGSFQAT